MSLSRTIDPSPASVDHEPRSPNYEPQSPDYEPRSPNYEPRSFVLSPIRNDHGVNGGGVEAPPRALLSARQVLRTIKPRKVGVGVQKVRKRRNERVYGEDLRVLRPLSVRPEALRELVAIDGVDWRLEQPTVELDVSLPQQQQLQQQVSVSASSSLSSSSSSVGRHTCDVYSTTTTATTRVPIALATPTFGRPYVAYELSASFK